MPFFGSTRLSNFDAHLRQNNIPIGGVGQSADAPEGITIDFAVEATPEQIAWANNARDEFDWRKRRMRAQADLTQNFAGLSAGEKVTLQANAFAIVALTQPDKMRAVLAASLIDLPLDEVDPNP